MANTNEKKKRLSHTTPKAECLFCHVVEADYGTKEFPKKDGEYNITLRLNEKQKEKVVALMADEIDEATENMQEEFNALSPANRKKLGEPTFVEPFTEEYDRQTEEPTGNYLMRFKTRATYEDRNGNTKDRKVPLFDCMGKPVEIESELGFGSVVKVNFSAVPYFVQATGKGGVSLYLNALQILKLVEFGKRSAADYGFSEEDIEDGFSADDVENLKSQGTGAGLIDDDDEDEAPKAKGKAKRKPADEDSLPEDF